MTEHRMRVGTAVASIVLLWLMDSRPSMGAVQADFDLVVAAIYLGAVGAAAGDVNADGSASAADLTGTAIELRSPTWRGRFNVGATVLRFTKASVTTGQPRHLDTVIWYPTDETGVEDRLGGIRDARVFTEAGPFPLLVFSHGLCGFPAQSIFLTAHLASHGLIVAAPPHPGSQLTDSNPPCSAPEAIVDSFLNRVSDVMFTIDSMLEQSEDFQSPFFSAVDSTRIGISGHSFGGQTTLRVAVADDRVTMALALAPTVFSIDEVPAMIRVPTMIMGGTEDTITPFPAHQAVPYRNLKPPKWLVGIANTGHFAFSDGCFPSPDCAPDRLTQEQAHTYVLRYAVPYVTTWLAGDPVFADFLEPGAAPPGVIFMLDTGQLR